MKQYDNTKCLRKTTIGGQALIEGLMMIGPDKKAMAVRNPAGRIQLEYLDSAPTSKIETIPFLRGPVKIFKQLFIGTKAMMRSAEIAEPDDETALKADLKAVEAVPGKEQEATYKARAEESHREAVEEAQKPRAEKSENGKNSSKIGLYISVIISLFFSVFLFMLLPGIIVDLLRSILRIEADAGRTSFLLTLFEGFVRVAIFIFYLWIVSKMKDIKRVWQYHGAEHKTIACYEAMEELTVDNIRKYTRFHPRCGTSFMFLVMIVSIIVLAFIGWRSRLINFLVRLIILPVIAAVTYEIIRLVGRYDNVLTRIISKPGLAMQRLTTAEPDDSMLEVAIVAMQAVLPKVEGSDAW